MVIKSAKKPTLIRRQLLLKGPLKGWSLAIALFLLALLLGVAVAQWTTPARALTLGLATAAVWASSSFDPTPRSWLSLVWQYATPWVIGLAGLVCFPMGLFLGVLTGSQWIGIVFGIAFGSLMSAALIASIVMIYDLLLLTVYQTQIFSNYLTTSQTNRVQKRQIIERYQQRQSDLSYTMALSNWSFCWSIFQGVAIAGLLVLGSFWGGAAGLLTALIWNIGVVATLIRVHHRFRQRFRRGQRFLLILTVLGAGVVVGALFFS